MTPLECGTGNGPGAVCELFIISRIGSGRVILRQHGESNRLKGNLGRGDARSGKSRGLDKRPPSVPWYRGDVPLGEFGSRQGVGGAWVRLG